MNAIASYLSEKGTFFPNSVVAATSQSDKCEFYEMKSDGNSSIGIVELPNKYGTLWIIDGQHRIFGSDKSSTNKPITMTLIQGMEQEYQANMFTTINQEASPVDPDLLWDLYGELRSLKPPPKTVKEEKRAIEYIISSLWKKINQNESHPLSNKIYIPSQTHGSKKGYISYGNTLCKWLKTPAEIWKAGYLRDERWKGLKHLRGIEYLISLKDCIRT